MPNTSATRLVSAAAGVETEIASSKSAATTRSMGGALSVMASPRQTRLAGNLAPAGGRAQGSQAAVPHRFAKILPRLGASQPVHPGSLGAIHHAPSLDLQASCPTARHGSRAGWGKRKRRRQEEKTERGGESA